MCSMGSDNQAHRRPSGVVQRGVKAHTVKVRAAPLTAAVLLAAALMAGCGQSVPAHQDFATGMTRSEISSRFGVPRGMRSVRKTEEAIWGPIETYWATVPMGSTVEAWIYQSRDETSGEPGTTELYFLDGA